MNIKTYIRKIFVAVLPMVFLSASCYAIQFSQPQEIGFFSQSEAGSGAGGMTFRNASSNNGDYYTKYNKNNKMSFGKGVAVFGKGNDALYVHYNVYQPTTSVRIGGKDFNNTLPVFSMGEWVYMVTSNEGVTLYPLHFMRGPEMEWEIYGRQKDGKFVRFINSRDITKRYIGTDSRFPSPVNYVKLKTEGDTLILQYRDVNPSRNAYNGEFRFKWDDKAQWFGVEQIAFSSSSSAVKSMKAQQRTANFEITDYAQFEVSEASLAFKNYHKAITEKRYQDAFLFLSPSFRKYFGTVEKFASGYETTISSEVTDIQLVSKVSLVETYSYKLKAIDYDGTGQKTRYFSGKVKLCRIHGEWKIDTNEYGNVLSMQQTDTNSKKIVADTLVMALTVNGASYEQVCENFCKKMKEQVTAEKFALLKEGLGSHIGGTVKNISFAGVHKHNGKEREYSELETLFYIVTTTDNKTTKIFVSFAEEDGTSKVTGVGLLP